MEPFGSFWFLILIGFSSALNHSLITVSSVHSSGVVLLTGPRGKDQFNFSEASEACLYQNLSMASKQQLEVAHHQGLEACRFGWLLDETAAVPRVSSVFTCGSGLLGVVIWRAPKHKKFGVWCFNSSDSQEDVKASKVTHENPTSAKTTLRTTTFTPTTISTTARTTTTLPKTSKVINPTTTGTVLYYLFTWMSTTVKPQTSSTQFSTKTTKPLLDLIHSSSSDDLSTWTYSTVKPQTSTIVSTQFSTKMTKSLLDLIRSSSSDKWTPTFDSYETTRGSYETSVHSVIDKTSKQRVLSTALIVFCGIVLILLIAGAFFYYKTCKRQVWSHEAQREDDAETKMWRRTSSELELRKENEDGEEEKRFTISSETTLYTTVSNRRPEEQSALEKI